MVMGPKIPRGYSIWYICTIDPIIWLMYLATPTTDRRIFYIESPQPTSDWGISYIRSQPPSLPLCLLTTDKFHVGMNTNKINAFSLSCFHYCYWHHKLWRKFHMLVSLDSYKVWMHLQTSYQKAILAWFLKRHYRADFQQGMESVS